MFIWSPKYILTINRVIQRGLNSISYITKLYLQSQLFHQGLCTKVTDQGKVLKQKWYILALCLNCYLPSMKEVSWELHESCVIVIACACQDTLKGRHLWC